MLIFSLLLSSCASTYPYYEKLPCNEIGDPLEIIRLSALTKFPAEEISINESFATFGKHHIVYSNIYKVSFVTKKAIILIPDQYRYILYFKNDEGLFALESPAREFNHKAFSAWKCLAGIE
jgi:hypothetical protein